VVRGSHSADGGGVPPPAFFLTRFSPPVQSGPFRDRFSTKIRVPHALATPANFKNRAVVLSSLAALAVLCAVLAAAFSAEYAASTPPRESPAAPAPPDAPPMAEPSFTPVRLAIEAGEELVYQVSWVGVGAGSAAWQVKRVTADRNGAPAIEIHLEVRSNALMRRLYRMEVDAVSLADADAGFTRFFKVDARFGGWTNSEEFEMQSASGSLVARYLRTRSGLRETDVPVAGPEFDPLSVAAALRGMGLQEGHTVALPVQTDMRGWPFAIEVLGRETLALPRFGPRDCFKVRALYAFQTLDVRREPPVAWVDAATGVILKAELAMPIGQVIATLARASGAPISETDGK
jgi:hypothetical protein